MMFDASTLIFSGGLVSLASGLFLLLHWWQAREDRAALWWGGASSSMGVAIVMLALHEVLPSSVSTIIAPFILDSCAAWFWAAARVFNRGETKRLPLVLAVGGWIAVSIGLGATGNERIAETVGLTISASFYTGAAVEFWLARGERLRGRSAMISLLSLKALALTLLAIEVGFLKPLLEVGSDSLFGIIHFVGLVFGGGGALSLVTMLKDRSELAHRAAALVDPLTGLANRRAFIARAQRIFEGSADTEGSVSLLAFDLDRFKSINDTFGHPIGDNVLRIFADVLLRVVRPADVAGRIGGEEFALALPACGVEAALTMARRIRSAFQEEACFVNGDRVGATVSVGVATTSLGGASFADIIASADRALYRAKTLGRNRVILAAEMSPGPDPKAIRFG